MQPPLLQLLLIRQGCQGRVLLLTTQAGVVPAGGPGACCCAAGRQRHHNNPGPGAKEALLAASCPCSLSSPCALHQSSGSAGCRSSRQAQNTVQPASSAGSPGLEHGVSGNAAAVTGFLSAGVDTCASWVSFCCPTCNLLRATTRDGRAVFLAILRLCMGWDGGVCAQNRESLLDPEQQD